MLLGQTIILLRCATGAGHIELLRSVDCNKNISQMSDEFAHYFDLKAGFENPYNKSEWAVTVDAKYFKKTGKCLWLGTTCMYGSGNKIYIGTNIGDEKGNGVFLNDVIVKE